MYSNTQRLEIKMIENHLSNFKFWSGSSRKAPIAMRTELSIYRNVVISILWNSPHTDVLEAVDRTGRIAPFSDRNGKGRVFGQLDSVALELAVDGLNIRPSELRNGRNLWRGSGDRQHDGIDSISKLIVNLKPCDVELHNLLMSTLKKLQSEAFRTRVNHFLSKKQ